MTEQIDRLHRNRWNITSERENSTTIGPESIINSTSEFFSPKESFFEYNVISNPTEEVFSPIFKKGMYKSG